MNTFTLVQKLWNDRNVPLNDRTDHGGQSEFYAERCRIEGWSLRTLGRGSGWARSSAN
jgi:hypothetical protein